MKPVSRGFLTPSDSCFTGGPWTGQLEAGPEFELIDVVPEWDYFTKLTLRRAVSVDLWRALAQTGIQDGGALGLTATWQSSWSGLHGAASADQVTNGVNHIELCLPGEQLGGRLTLETNAIMIDPGPRPKALAPQRIGSLLWSDQQRVDLEGTGSRFPVVPIAFSTAAIGHGRQGLWALTIDGLDLSASALGVLRVYLNIEHRQIIELLSDPDADQSRSLMTTIRYDVARQLLDFALANDEFTLGGEYPDASLGLVVSNIVGTLGQPIEELRARVTQDRGDLEAEFQATTGLFER